MNKKILILGGNSPSNKQFVDSLSIFLREKGNVSIVHYYTHRKNEVGDIDLNKEIEAVSKLINEHHFDIIIAKSIGTMVISGSIKSRFNPQYIFLGLSLQFVKDGGGKFGSEFEITQNHIIIQNEFDPQCTYGEVVELFGEKAHQIICNSGNTTHQYVDFEQIYDTMVLSM